MNAQAVPKWKGDKIVMDFISGLLWIIFMKCVHFIPMKAKDPMDKLIGFYVQNIVPLGCQPPSYHIMILARFTIKIQKFFFFLCAEDWYAVKDCLDCWGIGCELVSQTLAKWDYVLVADRVFLLNQLSDDYWNSALQDDLRIGMSISIVLKWCW